MDIRATRRALGLSQAGLADKLGLNQATISRFETGNLPIDERTKLAIEAIAARAPKPSRKPADASIAA
jgi:transcriptional regulator with XRE-family HTH domain